MSMVRRFLPVAQKALGCLVFHHERGLSLYGQQEYELSAGGDRRDLCGAVPLRLGTVPWRSLAISPGCAGWIGVGSGRAPGSQGHRGKRWARCRFGPTQAGDPLEGLW